MRKEEHRIDEMFREAAAGFEVEAPPRAWGRVAAGLDRAARLRRIVVYRRVAAVAAVLLAFVAGYYFPGKPEKVVYVANQPNPISRVVTPDQGDAGRTITAGVETMPSELQEQEQGDSHRGNTYTHPERHQAGQQVGNDNEPVLVLASNPVEAQTTEVRPISGTHDGNSPVPGDSIVDDRPRNPVTPELLPSLLPPAPPLADNGNARKRRVNWQLGGAAAPVYAYRSLESPPTEFSAMADNATEAVDNKEMPVMSYAFAVTSALNIGERFSLQSGLQYSRLGQSTQQPLVQYRFGSGSRAFTSAGMILFNPQGDDELSSKTVLSSDPHYSGQLVQYFDYLELPLVASYTLVDQKLDLSLFAGMSAGVLVGNNAWFIDESGEKLLAGYTYDLNRFVYGGTAGIGMEYPVAGKLSVNLQPGVRYQFTPLNDYSSVGNHPYSFTLRTGLQYRFGSD